MLLAVGMQTRNGSDESVTAFRLRFDETCGVVARSPSASRTRLMALFNPRSKSTYVLPAQILACSCSLVTNCPGRSRSVASTSNGWSCSLILMPLLRTSRALRSTSKRPKRIGDCV